MSEQLDLFDHWPPYCGPVSTHPAYRAWCRMLERCTNPNHRSYPAYGGSGILVDPAFRSSRAFIGWALWNGWRSGLELDRRNNDAGYSPRNCRWVTRRVNVNNRRNTVRLSDGTPLADAIRSAGLRRRAIELRIRRGWSPDEAVSVPVGSKRPLPDAWQSVGDLAAQAVATAAAQLQAKGQVQ